MRRIHLVILWTVSSSFWLRHFLLKPSISRSRSLTIASAAGILMSFCASSSWVLIALSFSNTGAPKLMIALWSLIICSVTAGAERSRSARCCSVSRSRKEKCASCAVLAAASSGVTAASDFSSAVAGSGLVEGRPAGR